MTRANLEHLLFTLPQVEITIKRPPSPAGGQGDSSFDDLIQRARQKPAEDQPAGPESESAARPLALNKPNTACTGARFDHEKPESASQDAPTANASTPNQRPGKDTALRPKTTAQDDKPTTHGNRDECRADHRQENGDAAVATAAAGIAAVKNASANAKPSDETASAEPIGGPTKDRNRRGDRRTSPSDGKKPASEGTGNSAAAAVENQAAPTNPAAKTAGQPGDGSQAKASPSLQPASPQPKPDAAAQAAASAEEASTVGQPTVSPSRDDRGEKGAASTRSSHRAAEDVQSSAAHAKEKSVTEQAAAAANVVVSGAAAIPAATTAVSESQPVQAAANVVAPSQSSAAATQPPADVAGGPRANASERGSTGTSNAHADSTSKNDGLTQAERVRFVQRVARAFQTIGNGEGQLRLRLSPPELGSLKLEVTLRDGVLTARLDAQTTTARDTLVESLPQLRERLAEQGIQVDRLEVNLMDQSSGGMANNAGGRWTHDPPGQAAAGPNQTAAVQPKPSVEARTASAVRNDGGELNVLI